MNILVLCTGNSARSILLEVILNDLGNGRVTAYSAGSNPSGDVHPQSLTLLRAKGYDVSALRSKSWDEFAKKGAVQMDMVITVCGSAASETCPIWPNSPLGVHWGIDDPAAAQRTDWAQAFDQAYEGLHLRAMRLMALPFETMVRGDLLRLAQKIATD